MNSISFTLTDDGDSTSILDLATFNTIAKISAQMLNAIQHGNQILVILGGPNGPVMLKAATDDTFSFWYYISQSGQLVWSSQTPSYINLEQFDLLFGIKS